MKDVSHKYTENGQPRWLTKCISALLQLGHGLFASCGRNGTKYTIQTTHTSKNPSFTSFVPKFGPNHRFALALKGSLSPPPLYTILPAIHAKFFDMLDAELCKVATFYTEKEKELHERSRLLKKQLKELGIHRQMFYESPANLKTQSWFTRACLSVRLALSSCFPTPEPEVHHKAGGIGVQFSELGHGGCRGLADTSNFGIRVPEHWRTGGNPLEYWRWDEVAKGAVEKGLGIPSARDDTASFSSDTHHRISINGRKYSLDPHVYGRAKMRLRKAVAEHYRGLEALNNYRILNLTGFRKVLRKYGKITKTSSVLEAYMKEKVEPCAFASGTAVGDLLKEMEHSFAVRFERGDRKAARDHLRVGPFSKASDVSTLRFGLWLGLAIPAISAGCYLSFQEYTRRSLPSWNILLVIYSIFFIPVLMALLIGINVLVWARSKINYVFIFSMIIGNTLNFRLSSCAPLRMGFGSPWLNVVLQCCGPSVWLALTFVVMFNPITSFMRGSTRWWTIKKIAKLGASGVWNVEFLDLWLGDQFCSLTYSISNLYFVGCFYTRYGSGSSAHDPRAQEAWSTCGSTSTANWGWYCLGMLPYFARFVQSLRRYRDSKLPGQLVNAGKYGIGMVEHFVYCYWRYQEIPRSGKSYMLFCFVATVNSLYGCAWDVMVDWSMCEPYARYPLLRRELVYNSSALFYYFALISNLCIRFIWLTYICLDKTSIELRTFVAAMLEMLRRVQWNFYRVEDKHLCNMAEHRATRELPLPYQFDADPREKEAEIARLQLRKRLARLS
ncbi:EXS family-domain-containing protein [Boletus reticuloceps]|uniref:EXS family-domain-containing protein n=1 Tax=Boletus reticuloceps TaxID=495285 RepID=A0A8I3ACX3_9AGAM|nr:EXS family-domain-containing protein [Boletus reticuloceps]